MPRPQATGRKIFTESVTFVTLSKLFLSRVNRPRVRTTNSDPGRSDPATQSMHGPMLRVYGEKVVSNAIYEKVTGEVATRPEAAGGRVGQENGAESNPPSEGQFGGFAR